MSRPLLAPALMVIAAVMLMMAGGITSFVKAQSASSVLCPIKAFDITFQPIQVEPRSFFTAPGQDVTVTRSKKFPRIIIRAVDSAGNLDPTVNNAWVTVTSNDPTTTIEPSTQIVNFNNGEAHFANLTILNGDTMMLNFTAVSAELVKLNNGVLERYRQPLHNKFVQTGLISVRRQVEDKFALQFVRTSSLVRYPLSPVVVVPGIPLPAIRLQVVNSAYEQYLPLEGLANNFSVSVRFETPPPPGTRFVTPTLEPIVAGFATFDNIIIETKEPLSGVESPKLPALVFTLTEPQLSTRTGPLILENLRDQAFISFESEDKSFIYTQGQDFSGLVGMAFPKITISVRDNMYRPASQRSGLIITASCARAPLTNKVAGVVDGVAVFDSLKFYNLNHEQFLPYVLTFTAGTQQNFRAQSIYTGIVELSTIVIPAYRFRFVPGVADAFFNGVFQRKQVVKDTVLKPPFRVELLRSDNTRDTGTAGASVTVSLENGKFTAASNTLDFKQGVAQSLDFKFTTTSIAGSHTVLSVDLNGGTQRLVTGRINVTNPVSNFDLRFQPYGASLFSAVGQSSFATINKALPPVVVELITSADTLDTGSNDITITVTASGATLTGSFVRVANGVAVFKELTFVSDVPGDFKLTFTAGDSGNAPVNQKQIITGPVSLFATVTPNVRPRFRNDSFIEFAGQSRPITYDDPMPTIVVELAASDHTPARRVNGTDAAITAEISLSNGNFASATSISSLDVIAGVLTLKRLKIVDGLDPVLQICFVTTIQSGEPPPADGQCISTGPLRVHVQPALPIGYLAMDKFLTTLPDDNKVAKGQVLEVGIAVHDTSGVLSKGARVNIPFDVEVTTSVSLGGTTRVAYNTTTGIALFSNLVFNKDFSAGISPALTFTAQQPLGQDGAIPAQLLNILPISTQLLSIQGAGARSGVDVVAEILADSLSFSPESWIAAVARRLNVESGRILQLRVFRGKSADPDGSVITEDTTEKPPSWSGTRFDMRFMPPLATSRDTRTAQDLADLFVNMQPSCKIGELKLRKAYFAADDKSCDWFIFDAQLASVRSCIQSKGEAGFCDCYVPLFQFMGPRCLGLPRMTSLCLNTLISEDGANCQQKVITDVCEKLKFPDAPRTAVAASGAVLFMCFVPIFYLYSGGFFHKINLPPAEHSRISKAMFVASDERDNL